MEKTRNVFCVLLLAVALCLSACGGSGGGSDTATAGQTGELSVGLTDATTNDFQAVYITVKEVSEGTHQQDADTTARTAGSALRAVDPHHARLTR